MTTKEDALFSFVQLNDMHVALPDRPTYARSGEKLESVIRSINAEQHFALPDFVLLVGDIIHGGSLESLLPECMYARQMLSELNCPYYPLLGNHEVVQREGDPVFQGPYEEVFGAERTNYAFVHGGVMFVCVNNSGSQGAGDPVSDARNAWLRQLLMDSRDVPKIVACHVPLVVMREEDELRKSFGFVSYKMLGDGMWDILRAARETVIAVLCGHLHLTGVTEVDAIVHICPSGTASYPCDYAHFTVYRNRIEVAMVQVDPALVTPETNLHGQRRHGRTFSDSRHPDAETYVAGTPDERRRTIPLTQAKIPNP